MADAAVISAETKRNLLERLSAEITSKKAVAVSRRRRRRLRHDNNATNKDKNNMSGRKRKRVVESTGCSIENEDDCTTGKATAKKIIVGNVKSSVIKSRFVLGINECTRTLEGIYKIIVRQ